MSERCPDAVELRLFAEGGALSESSAQLAQKITRHLIQDGCVECQKLVEIARREDALFREALAVAMPPDVHAATIEALDSASGETSGDDSRRISSRRHRVLSTARVGRGRTRRSVAGPIALSLALLGASALALVLASRSSNTNNDDGTPRAQPTPDTSRTTAPQRTNAPPRPDQKPTTPAIDRTAAPQPLETPSTNASPDDVVAVNPDSTPNPERTPEVEASRSPATAPDAERPGPALALLRSGKLSSQGKALATGDALPEDETLEVASAAVELESTGAAKLVVAPGTKLSLKKGDQGEPVFFLASGKLLASSSGTKPFAIASADGRAAGSGAKFLVAVESGKTRFSTLEGRVRVDAPSFNGVLLDVRAGFEAELSKGGHGDAPHPFAAGRAVAWLPEAARPKTLPAAPRVVRTFNFEDGEAWTIGTLVAGGARGSGHALKAVAKGDWSLVELEGERATLELQPNLWVELLVKLDKPSHISIELGGTKGRFGPGPGGRRGPGGGGPMGGGDPGHEFEPPILAYRTRVEAAAKWTTIAVPARDFMGPQEWAQHPPEWSPHGRPMPRDSKSDERSIRFTVRTKSDVELLVDDVRFFYEE